MSQAVQLSGTEHAERLLPLLKEYAGKLQHLTERSTEVHIQMSPSWAASEKWEVEAARLLCLFDTLVKPVTDLCRTASGLLEHADLESSLWAELKLRLDETEEYVRFSAAVVDQLKGHVTSDRTRLERLRRVVEDKTQRYKAPF
ncbi:MAG: hypothetical protein C0501_21230 [Isosphaera sp.]|nr:hypothetical protein [Isosphaera sp.]